MSDEKIVTPFGAAPKSETLKDFHDGTISSISGDRLVMLSTEGHLYSFMVAADADISCNGSTCRFEELEIGSKVRLTTKAEDKNSVTKIEVPGAEVGFAELH